MITIKGYTRSENAENRIISIDRETDDDFIKLSDVKDHMRIDFNDEDNYIKSLLTASRVCIENYIRKSLVPSVVTATIINQISGIELPWGPYVDGLILKDRDGVVINSDEYTIKGNQLFQYSYGELTAVYNAGYDEDTLPADLCMSIKQQTAYMYENRGDGQLSQTAKQLAAPYKNYSWLA